MSANEKRPVIEVTGLKKQYKLGQIGGGTLTHDLQSWWARVRGKEDPNTVIGTDQRLFGQTFMALNGVDLTVHKGEALFPRIDMEKELKELEAMEAAAAPKSEPAKVIEVEPQTEEKVDFDTFCKSDFRAVKVKACEAVPKSSKLLRFTLDDGTGKDRQILSGIAKYYKPEELVGKTLVAIVNLPPRKMMGLESCGMLISAVHNENGEEKLNLLMVSDQIPAGAKLC